ncbi:MULTISPECIES: hypothetical protein [Fischerella]|uniref:hypothetical protein n=1 Tax=Fischerella TaxID=1190 RepID=UPI000317A112|nr:MULTISPECIES: hypothetical protein [Fischerella]MBD2434581.1 hypothetical protein [Fischerella sp. FACHB-380]
MSVSSKKVFVPEVIDLKVSEDKTSGRIRKHMLARAKMLTSLLHLQISLMSENAESS